MSAAHYELCGLRLASEIPLSVNCICEDSDFRPDLMVRAGERYRTPTSPLSNDEVLALVPQRYALTRRGQAYVVQFFGICEFLISADVRAVAVHLDPMADEEYASLFLAGNVLSMLLALRGEFTLHASAVEICGNGLAVLGASGMGKSTLAAQLCEAGASLLTDDVLRVNCDGRSAECFRGSGDIRLRRSAQGEVLAMRHERRRATCDGRFSVKPAAFAAARTPLRAIVVPKLRCEATPALQLLSPNSALVELLRYPRILGWHDPLMRRGLFEASSRIARSVPVLRADLPLGPFAGAALATLLADTFGVAWELRSVSESSACSPA